MGEGTTPDTSHLTRCWLCGGSSYITQEASSPLGARLGFDVMKFGSPVIIRPKSQGKSLENLNK